MPAEVIGGDIESIALKPLEQFYGGRRLVLNDPPARPFTAADNEAVQKLYCDVGLTEAAVLLEKHVER